MKLVSLSIALAAVWLPALCAARHRTYGTDPNLKFGSMAANLQQAAAQSFLHHRIYTQDKELKFQSERAKKDELQIAELKSTQDKEQKLETERDKKQQSQIAELESRLELQEHRTSTLEEEVQEVQRNEAADVTMLKAEEQDAVSKLQARMDALELNAVAAQTEQAAKSKTQTRIRTVVHSKTKSSAMESESPVKALSSESPGKAVQSESPGKAAHIVTSQPGPLNRMGEVDLVNKEGLSGGSVMDEIKAAVADVQSQPEVHIPAPTTDEGLSLPSTWCPPPCDQHNRTVKPEVAAKIDQIHAAMAVVSGANTSEELESNLPQAREILMKSATERAHRLFSHPGSNEIVDQIPHVAFSGAHEASHGDVEHAAVASLSDHLGAAREADAMLNAARIGTEEKQVHEEPDQTSQQSMLPEALKKALKEELSGDAPQVMVVPIDLSDGSITVMNTTDQEEMSQESPVAKQLENLTQHAFADAAEEAGRSNDSVVVVHFNLGGPPSSQQVPVEGQVSEPQNKEHLKFEKNVSNFIRKMDSDTAKMVATAQRTHKKLRQHLKEIVEELKTLPKDESVQNVKKQIVEELKKMPEGESEQNVADVEPASQQEDAKMPRQQVKDAVADAHQDAKSDEVRNSLDDDKSNAGETQDADHSNAGEIQDEEELNKLSQEGLVDDGDAEDQPTVEEVTKVNKMSTDHLAHMSAEDQAAVPVEEEERTQASATGPVAAEDKAAVPVEEEERTQASVTGPVAAEDKAAVPVEGEERIQASAKGLVAAVAKEDAIVKEAAAGQKEDEQVDTEEFDRMSKVGVEATNELEAKLNKMDQ